MSEISSITGALVSSTTASSSVSCAYFTSCGGCPLHAQDAGEAARAKRERIIAALINEKLDPAYSVERLNELVAAPIIAHGEGRRRVTLHVRGEGNKMLAGFMRPKSHDLLDISHCAVLVPQLAKAADIARACGKILIRKNKPLDVAITATETGLDVDFRGSGTLDLQQRMALTNLANTHNLARLSRHGELLLERHAPLLTFGRGRVSMPAGGFLQATKAGENALVKIVQEAVGGAKSVADLFCGIGPFALPIAEKARVYAADSDKGAIAALKLAVQFAQGLKPLETESRDLFRRPLLPEELNKFEAVVFDPPRAGAHQQAQQMALSKVPLIVAVSCDVQSFSRDAGVLIKAGYTLEKITPVDQFIFSPHIEMVGVFRKI